MRGALSLPSRTTEQDLLNEEMASAFLLGKNAVETQAGYLSGDMHWATATMKPDQDEPTTSRNAEGENASATRDNIPRETDKCVTVIFNPVSGQGDPEERRRLISEALAEHGYRCQEMATTKEKGARALAEEALQNGVDLLAVSGGDGTVIEAMSALVGSGVPIAIFPAGTGNLLSVNLGLPITVPDAVHAALFGDRRKLDMAKIVSQSGVGKKRIENEKDRYFAVLAGVGLDAKVITDADREAKNKLGVFAYLFSALRNLGRRSVVVRIRLDDSNRIIRRRAKSVMVANMGRIQGGLDMIPGALPDDGLLEVAILKAETLGHWFRLAFSLITRRMKDDPSIEYLKARKVEVSLAFPQPMQFDGEETDAPRTGFAVEVSPQAVEVMVPKASPV